MESSVGTFYEGRVAGDIVLGSNSNEECLPSRHVLTSCFSVQPWKSDSYFVY
jgi:hypothetical protein